MQYRQLAWLLALCALMCAVQSMSVKLELANNADADVSTVTGVALDRVSNVFNAVTMISAMHMPIDVYHHYQSKTLNHDPKSGVPKINSSSFDEQHCRRHAQSRQHRQLCDAIRLRAAARAADRATAERLMMERKRAAAGRLADARKAKVLAHIKQQQAARERAQGRNRRTD